MRSRIDFLLVGLALFVLVTCLPMVAVAGERVINTPELTLDESIGMALNHSLALEQANLKTKIDKESRDQADSDLEYVPISGGSTSAEAEAAWYNLLSADLTWLQSERQATQEQENLALSVCQAYWDVQTGQIKLEAAKKAAEQADLEARIAQLKFQNGASSQVEATLAANQATIAKASVTQAENSLTTAYYQFNQLVGLWADDRPVLTDQIEFKPLGVTDIVHEVSRVKEQSPTTWLAEQKVAMAKSSQGLLYATGTTYRTYKVRQMEVKQAELASIQAEDATEELVRNLYSQVLNLEDSYRNAQTEVLQAEETLRVKKVQYEVGMATAAEVGATELSLVQAEANLRSALQQHAYYVLAFQKPWAMSG